jgi:hypothetical protein
VLYKATFFPISSSCVNIFPCCVMSFWILNYELPWMWITAFNKMTFYLKVLTFKWNPYKFLCLNSCFYPSPFQCFDSSMNFFSNRHSFKILLTLICFSWYIAFFWFFFFCTLRYFGGVVYMDKWSYLNSQTYVTLEWNSMLWNRTLYLWSLHRFGFFFFMMGQSN